MIRWQYLVTLILFLLPLASQAEKYQASDAAKEKEIYQQLQAIDPSLVSTFQAASKAMIDGNSARAITLFEKVIKKAPSFDPAMRREGIALIDNGQVNEGKMMLEKALAIKRSPENLVILAQRLFEPGKTQLPGKQTKGNVGTPADKARALQLAKEALKMAGSHNVIYPVTVAKIAFALDKEADFRQATMQLVQFHGDLMITHYFAGVLEFMDKHWDKAISEIKIAEEKGLSPEIGNMIIAKVKIGQNPPTSISIPLIIIILILGVGLLMLYISRKRQTVTKSEG